MNKNNDIFTKEFIDLTMERLGRGEAYMFCEDCGSKLYSFDGSQDSSKKCPYMKNGRCEPK